MSGPKVVRIVTREERIATCQGLLARLEAALSEWERVGRRNETVSEEDIRNMRARYAKLNEALAADRFDEIEREGTREMQFVQDDQERRLAHAVEKRKRARLSKQRTKEVTAELQAALGRNRTQPAGGVTDAQRALAQKLKESEDAQSFDQWLSEHAPSDGLEQRFAELSVLLEDADVSQFESRLRAVQEEVSQARRELLEDSLTVDLTKAVRDARQRLGLLSRLRGLSAELRQIGSASAVRAADLLLHSSNADTAMLGALETDAVKTLAAERDAYAAHMRRQVVLKGLASLGYQVNEGLETAWVRAGYLVIERPSQPGYGVELGGTGEKGRIQARVVAFRAANAAADKTRDIDAEQLWCSDFAHLGQQLAATGTELILEKALPVGAVPLKTVSDAAASNIVESAPALRERTLPRS